VNKLTTLWGDCQHSDIKVDGLSATLPQPYRGSVARHPSTIFTPFTEQHMHTDHPFSDHRIAMQAAIVNWLNAITKPQP
jgi:hypothetical protein